jgi:DNA invertase Pin-like site-specific DNA recombinase
MTQTLPVVAAYARISDDKADDAQGVARQIQDGTRKAEAAGYAVKAYIDNDVSAFKRHIVRPQFEAMLRDLEDGTLAGVVAYDLDRLWRQPIDLERAIEVYERRKGLWFATLQGEVSLSTSDGRMLARVMVAAANKSSADTARRVKRKHEDNQSAGKPAGGPRPFGFLPDRISHDPREADAIRWAVKFLMEGGTVAEVVRKFNADGITTTVGNPWRPGSIRATLRNPRLKGMRARWVGTPVNGWEAVTDASGAPVQAVWAPILTPDAFDALQAHLDGRTAKFRGGTRTARKYLLTGIARCGACGGPLRGSVGTRGEGFNYACKPPTMGGCGGVSRKGEKVDALVTEAVLAVMEAHTSGAHAKIEAVDRRVDIERLDMLLGDALVQWKAENLPSADYFAIRADLMADRKRLEAEQAESTTAAERARIALDAPAKWLEASIAKKRAMLEALVTAVVVHPLPVIDGRKVVKWNPALIEIVWQGA